MNERTRQIHILKRRLPVFGFCISMTLKSHCIRVAEVVSAGRCVLPCSFFSIFEAPADVTDATGVEKSEEAVEEEAVEEEAAAEKKVLAEKKAAADRRPVPWAAGRPARPSLQLVPKTRPPQRRRWRRRPRRWRRPRSARPACSSRSRS